MTISSSLSHRIVFLGLCGLLLSFYGVYVSTEKKKNENYTALCDVGPYSCSKVLTSPYGKMFSYFNIVNENSVLDVSNSMLGIPAYLLFVVYPWTPRTVLRDYFYVFAALISVLLSICLAYLLFFVLKDVCAVCIAIYLINGSLLWTSLQALDHLKAKKSI